VRISHGTVYALKTLEHLRDREGLTRADEVAAATGVPLPFLRRTVTRLVKANIITAKVGPAGGLWLARSLDRLTLLDVVEAVDGAAEEGRCPSCAGAMADLLRGHFGTAATLSRDYLAGVTVAKLLNETSACR
jgi:Rrf2 family protein